MASYLPPNDIMHRAAMCVRVITSLLNYVIIGTCSDEIWNNWKLILSVQYYRNICAY